jgi:two-component system osmolarity sensor histidine kinase EnvZ
MLRISLFWRTFLMLAALIAASLAATLASLKLLDPAPPEQQLAWELATVLNLTRSALVSADAGRRLALLDELAREEGVRVLPLEPGDRIDPSAAGPRLRAIEPRLRAVLGEPTQVAGRVNGLDGVWVSFGIAGDAYWLILPRERIERQFGPSVRLLGLIALLLSLLGALLLSRLVNRPLATLARAFGAVSRGEPPPSLPDAGPIEIAELNRRFNRMAADLAALERDRTIALAGISHDIRSPLARLRMEIEFAALDEVQREAMAGDIERIDRIVGQFVHYARIADPPRAETVDVAALIDALTAGYRADLDSGALTLSIETHPGLRWRGDPTDLARAIGNLIDNALRYGRSADGVAKVSIATRPASAGDGLTIEVSDMGPGVPADALDRLLRPFERLDAERSDAGGAGLGLAIVERIARRYGGNLQLASENGKGLAASLMLPSLRS